MKRIVILSILLSLFYMEAKAQYESDALRFSRMQHLGTARFNAMGGAFGALGGDFSSININPAGLGVYRSSEFTFTPGFLFSTSDAEYRGNRATDSRFNFNIGNLGYVGNYKNGDEGWKSYSFAVGYNRVSNFSNRTSFSGLSHADDQYLASSLIDDYVADINAANITEDQIVDEFPFGHYQAYYHTYLINPANNVPDTTVFEREFLGEESINQKVSTETRGGIGETFFSFGGNYNDKLYLGGLISFQNLRYNYQRRYEEVIQYETRPANELESFVQNEELIINGLGVNFKLGLLYRLNDVVRLGGAIHTPTFYSLSEEYTLNINSSFTNGDFYEVPIEEQAISEFEYRLHTPFRFIGSAAFVIGTQGLISVDYEHVDYSSAKLRDSRNFGSNYDFSYFNNLIANDYVGTHNVRVGGELRMDPFSLRAGIKYEDNPYAGNLTADGKRITYSLGSGFRAEHFFMDFAYLLAKSNRLNYPYATVETAAEIEDTDHYVTITAGFRF